MSSPSGLPYYAQKVGVNRWRELNVSVLSKYTKSKNSSGFKTSFSGNTGSTLFFSEEDDLYHPGSKPLSTRPSSDSEKPIMMAKHIF